MDFGEIILIGVFAAGWFFIQAWIYHENVKGYDRLIKACDKQLEERKSTSLTKTEEAKVP